MKKIVASVGLVALGASGIQTVSAQTLAGPDPSKPWSVALTLRGFYDSNPATIPNDANVSDKGTFGWEVSPSAALIWSPVEQTTINLGFLYSLKYYDTKPPGWADYTDQAFTFNAGVDHNFSEQVHVHVSDSFVIGQEPDLLRAGNTFSTFQTVSGSNIRNYGTIALDDQLTPTFGIAFGYDNAFYDYESSAVTLGAPIVVLTPTGLGLAQPIEPSTAGVLNRIENRAHLEGLLALGSETKGILGYQFTGIDYTGNQPISGYVSLTDPSADAAVNSSSRNTYQHTFYLGAEHNFQPNLNGAIRAGASYTDYYNDSTISPSWTPYVNATLKYTYATESYVSAGFSYDRNATDVVGLYNNGKYTQDAESAVLFASVNHRIDPRLFASLVAQFQNSTYYGGYANSQAEQYYLIGVNLQYKFNQYFSADIGYNYDNLQSELNRGYNRNRVYIGVTGSY